MFGSIFAFPHPVNEYAARVVAGCVLLLSILLVFTMSLPVAVFLSYGFLARVLAGPTLSPIGQIATKLVVPLIIKRDKPVAGPPKRFAQAVGLMVSGLALIFILTEQSRSFYHTRHSRGIVIRTWGVSLAVSRIGRARVDVAAHDDITFRMHRTTDDTNNIHHVDRLWNPD